MKLFFALRLERRLKMKFFSFRVLTTFTVPRTGLVYKHEIPNARRVNIGRYAKKFTPADYELYQKLRNTIRCTR